MRDPAAVSGHRDVSETTHRWRAQYDGRKAEDSKWLKELVNRRCGGYAEDVPVAVGVDAGPTVTANLTTRPSSRTFVVNAFAAANV